jgi:hypothetical protein
MVTTYTITIADTAIEVTTSPTPDNFAPRSNAPYGEDWKTVQVRIDGRVAWTQIHPTPTAALSLLSQYLHGWARLQTSDVDRRHEWRGWAEAHAEAVRIALGAMDKAMGEPWEGEVYGAGVHIEVTNDTTEVWTTEEVARWWPVGETAVSSTMQRAGVPVDSREPGRGGRNRYRADQVRAGRVHTLGRGARTDLVSNHD